MAGAQEEGSVSDVLLLLRRASRTSYLLGSWLIASYVLSIFVTFVSLSYYIYGGSLDAYNAINIVTAGATVSITIIFGFYAFRVADNYSVSSLRVGIILYVVLQALSLVLSVLGQGLATGLTPPIPSFSSLVIILVIALLVFFLSLGSYILLIVGFSSMKNKTGVEAFGTAMVLAIIGIFIGVLFSIALLLFGKGLSNLADLGERKRCPKCGKTVDPYSLYCPFCGTELR